MASKAKKPSYKEFTATIEDAVSDAFSEFESLGSEMEEWGDNIEEKFGTTSKYELIRETQENLQGLNAPDVPASLAKIEVTYPQSTKKKLSRANRCSNACIILDTVIEKLDYLENDEKLKDDAEELRGELDDAKSNAENAEFPGMYG